MAAPRIWQPDVWTPAASTPGKWDEGGLVPETLQVTLPGAGFLADSSMSRQGLLGSTLQGCYIGIPGKGSTPNVYAYATHNDGSGRFVGVDPGAFEAGLSGYTGVEVQLASGTRTAAQVAAAFQSALAATGFYDSVGIATDTITIDGLINAGAAFTGGSYDDAGGGTIDDEVVALGSVLGWTREDTASNSFTADTLRCQKFRAADLPSGPFRVMGLESYWGDTHTGQGTFHLYQGGAGSFDPETAVDLGAIGTTAGSALDQWVRLLCEPGDVIEVDPTDGDLWLVWAADAGATWNFEGSTSARPADSHFDVDTGAGNAAIWVATGTISGSGASFPATFPAVASTVAFTGAFRLVIQEAPYYGDFTWKSRMGLLQAFSGAGSSAMSSIFTSNAFTVPDVPNVEIDRTYVYYTAHDSGDQFRLEWWEGGTSDTVIATATKVWDAGQTTGTATGWVPIVASGSVPLTQNARLWLSVKAETGGSSIGFGGAGIGYTDAPSPAVHYRGAATESEYAASGGETAIDFDPSVSTASPLAPDSGVINNGNAVGVYGIVRAPGFAMVANP